DADDFGCGLYFFKQALVDQAVVKHNIGFAQACEAAHGNQVRISRSSADNEYGPEVLHDSITSFLQFVLARAEETSHKNCDGFLGVFEDSWSNSPPHEKGNLWSVRAGAPIILNLVSEGLSSTRPKICGICGGRLRSVYSQQGRSRPNPRSW